MSESDTCDDDDILLVHFGMPVSRGCLVGGYFGIGFNKRLSERSRVAMSSSCLSSPQNTPPHLLVHGKDVLAVTIREVVIHGRKARMARCRAQ